VRTQRVTAKQIASDQAVECLKQYGESALFTEQEIRTVINAAFLYPKVTSPQKKVLEKGILNIIESATERLAAQPHESRE
jgi:hypothetical protein